MSADTGIVFVSFGDKHTACFRLTVDIKDTTVIIAVIVTVAPCHLYALIAGQRHTVLDNKIHGLVAADGKSFINRRVLVNNIPQRFILQIVRIVFDIIECAGKFPCVFRYRSR